MKYAIEAKNLGKWFRRQGQGNPTLLSSLPHWLRGTKPDGFWALRNLNFKVAKGQTVGVVGPNGSGKSSLLSLVARTMTPTEGEVATDGRISALLELGAGFHPDLSGRENVFLNAAILGIPREDVRRRFDHIVDFAGLRDFIDMPVKHYSSGMYVRLAFAVAIEMKPDILLVDEVLAVGDMAFQMKCLDRIRSFQKAGKTILLVSHALDTVEEFCSEVLLIHEGNLLLQGEPAEVISTYLRQYMVRIGTLNVEEHGTREIEIEKVRLIDDSGCDNATFNSGSTMTVEIDYHAKRCIERPVFGFGIKAGNGFHVFGTNTQIAKMEIPTLTGRGTVRLRIDPLTLKHGRFFLSLAIHSWDHSIQYHRQEDLHPFLVRDHSEDHGAFKLHCDWEIEPQP